MKGKLLLYFPKSTSSAKPNRKSLKLVIDVVRIQDKKDRHEFAMKQNLFLIKNILEMSNNEL